MKTCSEASAEINEINSLYHTLKKEISSVSTTNNHFLQDIIGNTINIISFALINPPILENGYEGHSFSKICAAVKNLIYSLLGTKDKEDFIQDFFHITSPNYLQPISIDPVTVVIDFSDHINDKVSSTMKNQLAA